MELRVRCLDLDAGGKMIAVLDDDDAKELGVRPLDRIVITAKEKYKEKNLTVIVNTSEKFIGRGNIAVYDEVRKELSLKPKQIVNVRRREQLESKNFIKDKINGFCLDENKFRAIVRDVIKRNLNDLELAAFITSLYIHGLSIEEACYLSKIMSEEGEQLKWNKKFIMDKHSVNWDTPVLVREKNKIQVIEIGKFVDNLIEKNKKKIRKFDKSDYLEIDSNYQVLTFDNNFKLRFKSLTGVYRHLAPKILYKINLIGNRCVVTTHCHSLFVLRKGRIKSIPTKDLNIGDFVLVPREVPEVENSPKNINLIEELLKLPQSLTKNIFITKIGKHYKGIAKPWRVYQDNVPFNVYRKNKVKLPENAKLKISKGEKIPIKINISPEFVRLLGYWTAEGYVNENGVHFSLGTHEKELISDIQDCSKKVFGLETTITHPHSTAVHVNIYNQLLSKIFVHVLKLKKYAKNKEVPGLIFNLSRKLQLDFLRSYFKGDGYFRRNYEATTATSSKKLSIGLQYLLSICGSAYSTLNKTKEKRKFPQGHVSDISPSYYIYTQANSLFKRESNTAAYINFIPIHESNLLKFGKSNYWNWEQRRLFRRQKFVTFKKARELFKLIPDGKENNAKKIIFGNLGFLKVKSIEKVKTNHKYVYDLCVKNYENFVGGYGPIFLHNSLGGVPGDKTTLLLVPVIAAAGLTIPKTSSRAITSPSGTADRAECLMPVNLEIKEIKKVVNKTNGCIIWGGALNMAPADDLFIKIEYPLDLDPLFLPSIMAKKKAAGATHLVIDLPTGKGTKVKTFEDAKKLSKKFLELGKRLGIYTKCYISPGEQPVGYSIGPALEAREALDAIHTLKPQDLINKVCSLAGVLLRMADKGDEKTAYELLKNRKAEKKLREIIKEQGGDSKIRVEDIRIGEKKTEIRAKNSGVVTKIKNSEIGEVAKLAGAPKDKEAGVELKVKVGSKVEKNDVLFTIYSKKNDKLKEAEEFSKKFEPVVIISKRRRE